MSSGPDDLTAFERYLRRYSQLFGLKVDLEAAIKVEALQKKIMDDARRFLEGQGANDITLSDLLARLSYAGLLRDYIIYIGRELNDEVSPDKAEESLARAFEGDVNIKGARSALLAFQAVARALAQAYEGSRGVIDDGSPYCPVCGSESRTMVRRDDGFYMVCHVCGFAWRVGRGALTCPYCGNSNPFSVGLFTDKERKLGLAYCQECGSTWRVVLDKDVASAPRVLLPLLALAAERLRGALPALGEAEEGAAERSGEGGLGEGDRQPERE